MTFEEISNSKKIKINDVIKDNNIFFAHTKNDFNEFETLKDHLLLTEKYFLKIVKQNDIENIIEDLIRISYQKFTKQNITEEDLCEIKEMFYYTVYLHDIGKINPAFQKKLKNDKFKNIRNNYSDHSVLSAEIYLSIMNHTFIKNKTGNILYYFYLFAFTFCYPIIKHHGHLSHCNTILEKINIGDLNNYYSLLKINKAEHVYDEELFSALNEVDDAELFYLIKLLSSLLTSSDYYATIEYMNDLLVEDMGVLNENIRSKFIDGVKNISYNKELYENLEVYSELPFEKLTEFSNANLNKLRQKLSAEIITGIRKYSSNKLFYIEAPTGAGKTNLSLLALAEILKVNKKINKMFFVFPFTNLITQSFNYIKDLIQLTNAEIAELHSKAIINSDMSNNEEDDASYDNEKELYLNNMFFNYPVVAISHVTFFDILTSNNKKKNYLFNRIANSVVVIDEIQAYSPKEWDKINYLLNITSKMFNITYIVMSATLPKISKLLLYENSKDEFIYLNQNKDKYFTNPNFCRRVKFDYSLLKDENGKETQISTDQLKEKVIEKGEEYFNNEGTSKVLVGFVKKKTAHDFYEMIVNDERYDDYKKYILSGTILQPRRTEIINEIKTGTDNKIILVATQVIEAGLDIDMDLGFKDSAILDSDEQFAGRINRNCKKANSTLYFFNTGDANTIYKGDYRFKIKQDNKNEINDILENKNFDKYYDLVLKRIIKENKNIYKAKTLNDYLNLLYILDYEGSSKAFDLISQDSNNVFVPLCLCISHFTDAERNILDKLKINYNSEVDGTEIWNAYKNLIYNKNKDFISKEINFNNLSSIMSKYCFNIYRKHPLFNILLNYGEDDSGYLNLYNYKEIYSFDSGLKMNLEEEVSFI